MSQFQAASLLMQCYKLIHHHTVLTLALDLMIPHKDAKYFDKRYVICRDFAPGTWTRPCQMERTMREFVKLTWLALLGSYLCFVGWVQIYDHYNYNTMHGILFF